MKNNQIVYSSKEMLPDGWINTTLENTATVLLGLSPPSSTYNYTKNGLPFFQGKADFGRVHPTTRVWCTQPKRIVEENTLLLSVRAPIGAVNITTKKCSIGRGLAGIKPMGEMDTKFFFYFFHHARTKLEMYGTGTTFMAIRGKEIQKFEINLPPLNEQKRIISKIESIFIQIDTLEESLKSVKSRIDLYKHSVLKLAFEGRLVPQEPNDESTGILLERPHPDEVKMDAVQYKVPKGWTKTPLEKVVDILDSKRIPVNSKERSKRQGDIPYYGATGQVGYIDDYIFNEELVLLGEDGVLFLELLKRKAYLINGKSWVNNHAHVLRGVKVSNQFLCFFLNQIDYTPFVSGTTRLKLNQSAMKAIPIRFPDLLEQNRIVSKIKSVFAHVDMIDVHVARLLETLATLRQSVLKCAFEGKLVPQDPHDEPANELLEKIRGTNNG